MEYYFDAIGIFDNGQTYRLDTVVGTVAFESYDSIAAEEYFVSQRIEYDYVKFRVCRAREHEKVGIEDVLRPFTRKSVASSNDVFFDWFVSIQIEYVKKQREWQDGIRHDSEQS